MADDLKKQFEPKPLGKPLTHDRQLFQARFSPCGKRLVACGYDAAVQRWDATVEPFKPLEPITGHNAWVPCLAMHPTEDRLFTADSWGKLACRRYLDAIDEHWSLPQAHDGWIRAMAISPKGDLLATGGNDATLRLWSTADGKLHREWKHPGKIMSLCFHPTDGSLLSGDLPGAIRQWDVTTGQATREFDAKVLYQKDKIQECGGVRHIAFDATAERLLCAGQKTPGGGFATGIPCVLVFDAKTGERIIEMPVGATDDGFAHDAQFHPAGFVMATGCAFPGKGQVWFWKPEDKAAFYLSDAKLRNGRSLSLHPDGKRLAILISIAPNANGRPINGGAYLGGSASIQIFTLGQA